MTEAISRRDYFAAHAPAEIPDWFEPTGPLGLWKNPEPPERPAGVSDREWYNLRTYAPEPDDADAPAVAAWKAAWRATRAERERERQAAEMRRLARWRWAWADAMLHCGGSGKAVANG